MQIPDMSYLFHIDRLSIIMMILVTTIGFVVYSFSSRYMAGDRNYSKFMATLALICGSVIGLVCSDHLLLFLFFWSLSNYSLVKMMIHKPEWKAARLSGKFAHQNFLMGQGFMIIAFTLLYSVTGESTISGIIHQKINSSTTEIALLFLLLAAMSQSAIFPFHRWLISSLNSPTPVSALMHAGLVNGGGFLIIRFFPLYSESTMILNMIFIIGVITAFLGILWKLMQHDVKRMLACSTVGQMGFMFVQIGLGLFPAAISHLFWHGMFKAYLFLASGAAAQEKRLDTGYPPDTKSFLLSIICGFAGCIVFSGVRHEDITQPDTSMILLLIVFITACQFSLPLLRNASMKKFFSSVILTGLTSGVYALSINAVASVLAHTNPIKAHMISWIHIVGAIALLIPWLAILFYRKSSPQSSLSEWKNMMYVKALNNSQPYKHTITSHRNSYQY